jgi:hypothetical protein
VECRFRRQQFLTSFAELLEDLSREPVTGVLPEPLGGLDDLLQTSFRPPLRCHAAEHIRVRVVRRHFS